MRQKRLAVLGFFMCSAMLFFQPIAFAKKIDEASYQYPYKDPYLATTTVALMNGSEKLSSCEIKDLRIEILANRNNIRLLEGKGLLRYRFYQQKGLAPLVYIIPGLAGSAYSGTVRFLAEWLADHGFHVLILPSPLNWNFTLAASTTGAPGHSQEDTRDLYAAMGKVLDDVKINQGAQVGKIGVLGLSDGALYSVYLSKMDEEKRRIGIQTYLLVNPPVDLFEAVRKIDKMADIGKGYSAKKKKYIEDYALGVISESMARDSHDSAYFQDWDKRFKLRGKEIQYVIGKSMRDEVGDAIYAIDLANDESILKTPVSRGYRSEHLEEARSFSLMEYVEKVVIPRLRQSDGKTMNLKQLEALNSIRSIASTLANKRSVFLMHNLDDILVSREDVLYLEKALGDRAIVYPHGGHLGNLWHPDNKEHIVEIFRPLLQGTVALNP